METVISELHLINKTVIINWSVTKISLLFATKLTNKILDPSNTNESCQLYLEKNHKFYKNSQKIVAQEPETFGNPNIAAIKSVIIEHLETSHKLYKTIRQTEKVSHVSGGDKNSASHFYGKGKPVKIFWMKKMHK